MKLFISNFRWIMLVSGMLTFTMIIGLFSPETSLKSNFGETVDGSPAGGIIVRNWSALIALMGANLIYGAFVPAVRRFSLIMTGASKIVFITLVLSYGKQFLGYGVGTAVVVDTMMVVLYAVYLFFTRKTYALR